MLGSPITLTIYVSMVVLAGGFFGHFLIRRGRKRSVLMLALGHVFGAGALYVGAMRAQETYGAVEAYASVPYLLFLFLLVLPSLVGVLLGAGLGWWRGPVLRTD